MVLLSHKQKESTLCTLFLFVLLPLFELVQIITRINSRVAALTGTNSTAAGGRRKESEFGENRKHGKRQ